MLSLSVERHALTNCLQDLRDLQGASPTCMRFQQWHMFFVGLDEAYA